MLEGYITDRIERKNLNDTEVEITTYQGEHCNEILLWNVKNGRCELFDEGVLQFSWTEIDGKRIGEFVEYSKGKATFCENWNSLLNEGERRLLVNSRDGLELVVEENGVVYRGGYDSVESMKREGRGMEYDEKSGRVLRCGVWKNDELFHIEKVFGNEDIMKEFAIDEGMENVSLLNRHPVYEGGYVFDEEKREVLRHGYGCEIDVNTGIAVREGKWERGVLKESVELFDGWYVKREGNDPFDWELTSTGDLRVEIHSWNEWENVNKRVTELVIPANCCNEEEWSVFDASDLRWLKSIKIGDECFENVDEVKLIEMKQLENVVIGKDSFTKHKNSDSNDPNCHFYLKNCERLRELKMGNHSFVEYSVCEIENVPSLEVIEMGALDESSANFSYASLELKSDCERMK